MNHDLLRKMKWINHCTAGTQPMGRQRLDEKNRFSGVAFSVGMYMEQAKG
jgi:hypothetical protein